MSAYMMVPLGSGSYKPETFYPASYKQVGLLTNLLAERVESDEYKADITLMIEANELSKKQASKEIEHLFSQPKVGKASAAKVAVAEGYYFHEAAQTVYEVVKAKTTGNLYAKSLVPAKEGQKKGSWQYAPGAMKKAGEWKALTLAEAAALGKTWGYCAICGRTLTNPASIEAGIGPICASKF